MRSGVLISVVSHIVLVALALLGTPKLFDGAATRPIEVELVRPEEAPPEKPPEPPKEIAKAEKPTEPGKPEKEKPAPWDPLPDQAQPWPDQTRPKPNEQQASAQPQTAQPQQSPAAPQPGQGKPAPQAPTSSAFAPQTPAQPSIFDPVNITKLLDLPNASSSGFDSESTTSANISQDDRAAFKAHVRKCWQLPGNVAPESTKYIVMRVALRRDGKLGGDPMLIEGSASAEGVALMQAAQKALKECQPYSFLPATKYSEWKVLDLRFSARDMAGG